MEVKETLTAKQIVQKMYDNDAFSQWLGIEIITIKEGFVKLKMTTRKEMMNGFNILHGGISYSFADTALAFAANTYGQIAMSIDTQISHIEKVGVNEELFAEASSIKTTSKSAFFNIIISNSTNEIVAHFKGTAHRTKKEWNKNTL